MTSEVGTRGSPLSRERRIDNVPTALGCGKEDILEAWMGVGKRAKSDARLRRKDTKNGLTVIPLLLGRQKNLAESFGSSPWRILPEGLACVGLDLKVWNHLSA